MNPSNEISKKLWEYMKKNPVSVNEMGKRIGISHSTLMLLLRGQKYIQPKTLFKIERFLKQYVDDLIETSMI